MLLWHFRMLMKQSRPSLIQEVKSTWTWTLLLLCIKESLIIVSWTALTSCANSATKANWLIWDKISEKPKQLYPILNATLKMKCQVCSVSRSSDHLPKKWLKTLMAKHADINQTEEQNVKLKSSTPKWKNSKLQILELIFQLYSTVKKLNAPESDSTKRHSKTTKNLSSSKQVLISSPKSNNLLKDTSMNHLIILDLTTRQISCLQMDIKQELMTPAITPLWIQAPNNWEEGDSITTQNRSSSKPISAVTTQEDPI